MAEEFGWITDMLAQGGSAAYDLVLYLLIALVMMGAIIFILWYLGFKHEVTIRYLTKTRKFIIKDKAKIKTIEGVPTWRLFKMKADVKPPPPESLEITKRGKFFAECYWSEDNPSPVWLIDSGDAQDAFTEHAYTSDERAYAVATHHKALARRKVGLMDRIIQLAPLGAMVMIVAIVFIFWGEITAPTADIMSSNAAVTDRIGENIDALNQVTANLARVIDAGGIEIRQDIPPDVQGVAFNAS